MRVNDVLNFDAEYVKFAPVMQVADDAREAAYLDMRCDEEGIIGEQLAEIGSERALDGSPTPMDDARRIWVFQRVTRAVARFAREAPKHADACEQFNLMLPF